ncbi:MAG: ABC-2 transporter permease [Oscillospiraceae bacterium]|nr:ABC-2 transporter permease [Oscillospiraceae bacterium]MDD6147058.1 ABC-2 transporter permease [Oscillospiraceae bacterium]
MKGLLLKDFYMLKKYCRAYLLIAVVFIAVSFFSTENMFFVFYPCIFCSMIPVNLLGYDERSRFLQYSGTLPYTKAQFVSGKYVIGLLVQLAVLLATGIAQAVRMKMNGVFDFGDLAEIMLMTLVLSAVTSSVCLPFMFKWGVEKGRIAYYVTIGMICALSVVASGLFSGDWETAVPLDTVLPVLCLVGVGIYALSWYLSIVFFKKREVR